MLLLHTVDQYSILAEFIVINDEELVHYVCILPVRGVRSCPFQFVYFSKTKTAILSQTTMRLFNMPWLKR
jgi:hypothetical protein